MAQQMVIGIKLISKKLSTLGQKNTKENTGSYK